jgi:hypothetical protein
VDKSLLEALESLPEGEAEVWKVDYGLGDAARRPLTTRQQVDNAVDSSRRAAAPRPGDFTTDWETLPIPNFNRPTGFRRTTTPKPSVKAETAD